MKIQLIYSKSDTLLADTFQSKTMSLVAEGKMKFVSEQADCALLLLSPALLNDVFCYQAFLTAKYYNRSIRPVLMKYCLDERGKYEEILQLAWRGDHLPSTGNYIYNPNGTFRSGNYPSLDTAWDIVVKELKRFIETNKK